MNFNQKGSQVHGTWQKIEGTIKYLLLVTYSTTCDSGSLKGIQVTDREVRDSVQMASRALHSVNTHIKQTFSFLKHHLKNFAPQFTSM